ncbi:hypothetical protein [Amycolatopsis sp. NPDC004625]|uniref:hypothetical protein n=1 Tax=Amycolatopsis sp. NPDC004625 TaxID=3154670 RepID=UPI0033BA9D54
MTDSGEALLLQTLGENFLAYVTATTLETIRLRLTQTQETLSAEREEVLGNLVAFVQQVSASAEHAGWLNHSFADVFGRIPDGESDSVANSLRRSSGGDVWEPTNEDPATQELLVALRDVYPIMLLPEEAPSPINHGAPLLSGPLHRHPRRERFEAAVIADEVLIQLFPEEREGQGRVGIVYSSAGHGGGTQLWLFAGQLIGAGWEWAKLTTRVPSLQEHVTGAKSALNVLIAAIKKKPAKIPVRVGVTGVLLPDGCEHIELGWATLRRADERDENSVIDNALAGSLQANQPDGTSITIKYSGDIVMEMDIEYRLRLKEIDVMKSGWPLDLDPSLTIEKRLENLRLGLLLAFPDEQQPVMVAPTWTQIVDPTKSHILAGWNDPRTTTNLLPRQLSTADVDSWKEWAILIGEKRQKSIDVSIRRALLAASQRPMPEDKLVDAVVVWENLFGAAQETTLRVTTSLAWLLAEGADERKGLRERFSKIYRLRSGIVHGSKQLTREEAQTEPDEALKIALNALRAIFRDRPDLIDEADGGARSNRVLIGD